MHRLLVFLLLIPASANAEKYTLSQLLAKVKAEYPGVVAAREAVGSADAQLSQARRLWAPTGLVTAGFTLAPAVHCQTGALVPPANLSPADLHQFNLDNCIDTDVHTDNLNNNGVLKLTNPAVKVDIQITQPIYTSGKIEAAIKAAHAGKDVASAQVDAATADVTLSAVRAYWGLKWARASAGTLDEGQRQVKEWVDKIDQQLSAGTSIYTEQDLFRLKIALDNVELGLLDVRKAERLALAGLRTLSGDDNADIDDDELDVIEVVPRPLSYYEDAARTHRPEARMLDAGRTAVHAQRNLRLAEMLPDLGLIGTFDYSYVRNVDTPTNSFMNHANSEGLGLYLGLRQTLDIAEKLARFDQARADERVFAAKRREALGGIALEIERAFAEAEVARKRHTLAAHGEKLARGWYHSMNQATQVGVVASAKDMVDSARSYFELRLQYLSAIMDLNVSLAALKRAAGVD